MFLFRKTVENKMEESDWPNKPFQWSTDGDNVKSSLSANADVSLEEIVENSSKFRQPFPIETVRCHYLKTQIPKTILETNINSTYPLLHESSLFLYANFLLHKRKYGTTIEKNLYKNMNLLQLIDRLLTKRAVMFVGIHDHYALLTGEDGVDNWETIGTNDEKRPLILANCLSYDEIKLSSLLSVSSHTYFINNGNRQNRGVHEENRNQIQDGGVIIGVIGPRLVRTDVMEHQDVVITKKQNVKTKGYDPDDVTSLKNLYAKFYECDPSRCYHQLKKIMTSSSDRYVPLGEDRYMDKLMLSRRLVLSIDVLLIEANERAKNEQTMAYVHVVGIGLGVWKICRQQDAIFMETFEKRIEFLSGILTNVSDVRFAYIGHEKCGKYGNGDVIPVENHEKKGIKVHIGKEDPHLKLTGTDEGKLLVVSYAWDGNALPGNEFWAGNLSTSSDPAAACSTQITELHNAHINPKVSSANLRVATMKGLVTFQEFQELHKDD